MLGRDGVVGDEDEVFDVALRVEKNPSNMQLLFVRNKKTMAYLLFEVI